MLDSHRLHMKIDVFDQRFALDLVSEGAAHLRAFHQDPVG